ncbi:hypothetical protein PVBG_06142 [Plasmodium vivax Brazil I]|uniref:Variable surface protein Vir35 n=1 Tax=Plasmodium vivax (strain Brazil I) TaxID=1033975 RepID=A0A0J9T1R5_PLAV1|nr:hypothetical protein PVBG_06142 [Plasmodium vivax Brazil I]
MLILRNYNLKESMKSFFVLKILTFIFLICIWNSNYDIYNPVKLSEKKFKEDGALIMYFNRLLAKHALQSELEYRNVRDKLSDNTMHNRKRKLADHYSTYSQLKRKESNNLDVYMKDYKRRYRKKNGLLKLDCYCEKKAFDIIHSINEIAHKYQNNKKGFKNFLFKKHGLFLILLALLPGFGLVFPILFGTKSGLRGAYKLCTTNGHTSSTGGCNDTHLGEWKTAVEYMELYLKIFSFTLVIINLLFFIYMLIKIIKYEKLKAGKYKMNINEYYHLCKDIF